MLQLYTLGYSRGLSYDLSFMKQLSVSDRVFRLTTTRLSTEFYTRVTRAQRCLSPEFRKLGCAGRADEDHSGGGLSSSTIHITGQVKHLVMRTEPLAS